MLNYADLDNTFCTPTNQDAQMVLWMENISLYYVSGCEIQDHSIARLEIITTVLPKFQVFWNVRPYPLVHEVSKDCSTIIFGMKYLQFSKNSLKLKTKDAAVIHNFGNYVITIKLHIRQTLLFINQITSLSDLAAPCFGLDFY